MPRLGKMSRGIRSVARMPHEHRRDNQHHDRNGPPQRKGDQIHPPTPLLESSLPSAGEVGSLNCSLTALSLAVTLDASADRIAPSSLTHT